MIRSVADRRSFDANIRKESDMGAIAEALAAYAQPLLDRTDGSIDQVNKAFLISQACFNLAMWPDDKRDRAINELQSTLNMDDGEFDAFRRSIILPMIQRHRQMFPRFHGLDSPTFSDDAPARAGASFGAGERTAARSAFAGTRPYAPCPCNSGRKYKFCCGRRGR
jgi:hypothetical protein